jgi:hypothetical protein
MRALRSHRLPSPLKRGGGACAQRSTECSKRSERYSMSCRRRFKGRRECTEQSIEHGRQELHVLPPPDASGSVHALTRPASTRLLRAGLGVHP